MDTLALYLAASRTAHPIADWALDQLITYGPGVILVGALYGLYCTSDAVNEALADYQDAWNTDTRKED